MEKRVRARNIIKARLSSGVEGKGTEIFGKKIKFSKNEGGDEYQIAGNFIRPC